MNANNPVALLLTLSFIVLLVACSTSTDFTPSPIPTTIPENTPTISAPTLALDHTQTTYPTPTPPQSLTPESSPTPPVTPLPGPLVSIGDAQFVVDVADTGQERSKGLSGRSSLASGTGMLFVFEQPGNYSFWMIEMQFPLDFVWIGADCAVVDLMEDVPPQLPGQSPGDLPLYRPAAPVQYVLEIKAGDIQSAGIRPGDPVTFEGELAGTYGC